MDEGQAKRLGTGQLMQSICKVVVVENGLRHLYPDLAHDERPLQVVFGLHIQTLLEVTPLVPFFLAGYLLGPLATGNRASPLQCVKITQGDIPLLV